VSEEFEKTMTDGLRAIYKQLFDNNRLLERVVQFLEEESARKEAPNYQQHLEEFATFDWASIGATVERSDAQGAAVVNWKGKQFIRRSPVNKYEPVVFFSRCIGNDEQGVKKYERLCTFKSLDKVEVEPISDKAAKLIRT
jgi:hypothetical protein